MRPEVNQRRYRRQLRLDELGYKDYPNYLRSPHWLEVRIRYRDSDQPQECICGEDKHLQLHHMTYERIGAEELTDLTPLCATCHSMIHVLEARGEIGLDFTGFVNEERAKRNRESMVDHKAIREADRQEMLDEIDGWEESLTSACKNRYQKRLVWPITRELKRLRHRVETLPYWPTA